MRSFMFTTNRPLPRVAVLLLLTLGSQARADSVGQIATSLRISRTTATLIDPQGRPGETSAGTSTAVRPGDILTFIAHFTPVPNGGTRGLGGYVTIFVPRNTEVVGARIIDVTGATLPPNRGGLAADGTGPRGGGPTIGGRDAGSMAQLYADTGIFFSTDPRTARVPDGSGGSENFLTIFNGILLSPPTTAAGQLAPILGADPSMPFAHSQWDAIQAYAFGVSGAALGTNGRGVTPDQYGSPVAGPDTWYPFEASSMGPLTDPIVLASVVGTDTVGPWQRIQTLGAERGRRGATPPVPDPGMAVRIGEPAVDADGNPIGVALSGSSPLPSFDSARPTDPWTRAVRYAVGELVVGREYLSEISLRVLDTPLDPVSRSDVVCAEVFGGDASAEQADGTKDGKDNPWRYFFPAPACVSLDLLFDLDVSELIVVPGDRLTYTVTAKNLATTPHRNTVVRYCYESAEVSFVSASGGGVRGSGAGCPDPALQDDVRWTVGRLDPGEEVSFTIEMDALGGGRGNSTIGRAIFTSRELPAPGFQTVAFTVVDQIAVPLLSMVATPDFVAAPPSNITYMLTVDNSTGTGDIGVGGCRADPCRIIVDIPAEFSYRPGTARWNGATIGDPTVAGHRLTFTAGLADISSGDLATLSFGARVPSGTPSGVYTATVETWLEDAAFGPTINDSIAGVAEVVVGVPRSEAPTIDEPLFADTTVVCGATTEAEGTAISVRVAGIEVATAVSDRTGRWCATVPTLFAGQHVSATATAPGKIESASSGEIVVRSRAGVVACNDGIDNDGDGLIDFPEDPDCDSAADTDEARVPRCADGLDNDGDGFIDFGEDPSCSSLLDDDESGPPACANGVDDDGDGATDFPDDPGCDSANDVDEHDVPACANGIDDDGDGQIDYPADDGCRNATDGDETATIGAPDGGTMPDAGASDAGAFDADAPDARVPDGGGVAPDWGGVDAPGSGCGCSTLAAADATEGLWLALVLLGLRRRSR